MYYHGLLVVRGIMYMYYVYTDTRNGVNLTKKGSKNPVLLSTTFLESKWLRLDMGRFDLIMGVNLTPLSK